MPETVLLVRVAMPRLCTPPPTLALLPETVLFVSVAVPPPLYTPPPAGTSPPVASPPLTVVSLRVRFPPLLMAKIRNWSGSAESRLIVLPWPSMVMVELTTGRPGDQRWCC